MILNVNSIVWMVEKLIIIIYVNLFESMFMDEVLGKDIESLSQVSDFPYNGA